MRRALSVVCVLLVLLVFVSAGTTPVAGEDGWDALVREAETLMEREALRPDLAKRDLLMRIAADDSERAAALIVEWTLASRHLEEELDEDVERAVKKHARAARRLARKARRRGEDDPDVRARRREIDKALENAREVRDAERAVDAWAAEAMAALTARAAWEWMFEEGLPQLLDADYDGDVLVSVIRRVPSTARGTAFDAVVQIARAADAPEARVRALDRLGGLARRDGPRDARLEAAVKALEAETVAVRRAALRALWRLDDPACVKPLVDAAAQAGGLLAVEIDDLLFWFTGVSMGGEGRAWTRWWREHGPHWKATGRHERHDRRPAPGDAAFYGITSPSKRIVFVIDHSGSMQKPSGGLHATTGEPMGRPRMVEAKAELARAVRALAPDVRFNILFYSGDVWAWREAPALVRASEKAKAEAVAWLEAFEPETSTALFEALDAVFGYADDFGGDPTYTHPGVDTVFLLTDGIPTHDGGRPFSAEEIDAALARFHEKNAVPRIVVNGVGVGRGHDRALLRRLAERTGGSYVSVATE